MEDLVEAMGTGLKAVSARGAPDCTLYPHFLEPPTPNVFGYPSRPPVGGASGGCFATGLASANADNDNGIAFCCTPRSPRDHEERADHRVETLRRTPLPRTRENRREGRTGVVGFVTRRTIGPMLA